MAKMDMSALTTLPVKGNEKNMASPETIEVLPEVFAGSKSVLNAGDGSAKVMSAAISMPIAICNELISTANHLIDAYTEIQRSHDQVKIVEAQARAFISGKREETRQLAIEQENETIRFLEKCRTDLEIQRLECEKFALEISDRREARLIKHERWQSQIESTKEYANILLQRIEAVQTLYAESGFQNNKLRDELRHADEKMLTCLEKIRSLSVE